MSELGTEDRAAAALRYIRGTLEDLDAGRGTAQGALWEILITARSGLPAGQVPPKAPAKFDEAAFDAEVSKPNGWSGVADPVAEIRRMRDGDAVPGNAAAMRAALEDTLEKIDAWRTDGTMEHWQYSQLFDICDAALSAPARNCDRFRNFDEAIKTYAKENNVAVPWDMEKYARMSMWLFAPAEGGEK